jgi:hypothetical protein
MGQTHARQVKHNSRKKPHKIKAPRHVVFPVDRLGTSGIDVKISLELDPTPEKSNYLCDYSIDTVPHNDRYVFVTRLETVAWF